LPLDELSHRASVPLLLYVAVWLAAAALTRNLDVPKLPVRPLIQTTTTPDGKQISLYGFGGSW